MNQDDIMNKSIVFIDNNNATFLSNNNYVFNYDLLENIKDIACIKIMKSEIILNTNVPLFANDINSTPQNGDPIFIKMNDYKRVSTIINGNNIKFFDVIILNTTDKNTVTSPVQVYKNESCSSFNINDPTVHIFNPTESNIKTLSFELYDKNNKILERSTIIRFSMVLCIYHYKRKVSQY